MMTDETLDAAMQMWPVRSGISLSSPAILMVIVWIALLAAVAFGPIDYSMQPSMAVLGLTAGGAALFIAGHWIGLRVSKAWFSRSRGLGPPSQLVLNRVVAASSVTGIVGIALIALDRVVLSGASNGDYTQLLRCAPTLVDIIEIRRTPLLYLGYLTFSFSYAALVLFLLEGERVRGWIAALAQFSVIAPIGYALLYSGRMPILFFIVLVVAAVLVRWKRGLPALPLGQYLLIKTAVLVLLFAGYSSAMWSIRQNFCVQMSGLIRELQLKLQEQELAHDRIFRTRFAARDSEAVPSQPKPQAKGEPTESAGEAHRGEPEVPSKLEVPGKPEERELTQPDLSPQNTITAAEVSKRIRETRQNAQVQGTNPPEAAPLLSIMIEAWQAPPRAYTISLINSGAVPSKLVMSGLSSYFYLTHGVRILDMTWRSRREFSPHWGVYEIGVLSPILRVFFPQNELLATLNVELKSVGIYGFFPTVWAAAFIDFGAVGLVVYVLIWGFVAGWSYAGVRSSASTAPALLLAFVLASVMLSPVNGPLGVANSALVLASLLVVGAITDFATSRAGSK